MSRPRTPWNLLLAMLAAASIAAAGFQAVAADDADTPTAIIVYGDRENGFALATLLIEVGLDCKPVPYADVKADWTTDADLVVFASCCPGGWQEDTVWSPSLLDRVGTSRVVACGNTGASLLETKALLVGHPHGAHWPNMAAKAQIARAGLGDSLASLLEKPHALRTPEDDPAEFTLAEGLAEPAEPADPSALWQPEHIGIYDTGTFPEGSRGIARMGGEAHHWVICRQGNYTLWGVDSTVGEMTDDGRHLLANLCWHLAHAAPEPLVFPKKQFVEDSIAGTLKGRSSGEFYHKLARTGRLTIRLTWKGDNTMMLMTHQSFTQRVDGASPLVITQPVNDAMQGREVEINVTSFDLLEIEECAYEVTLDWED